MGKYVLSDLEAFIIFKVNIPGKKYHMPLQLSLSGKHLLILRKGTSGRIGLDVIQNYVLEHHDIEVEIMDE